MPTKLVTTWVLVADGAKARILERKGMRGPLSPVSGQVLAEAEARRPTRETGSDRPGRVHESADTARHAMEPRVDWRRFAKERFAGGIAGVLEEAALENRYQALIVVAPPQALGDLRGALGPHTAALVTREIARDLTNLPDRDIPAHLE